MSTSPNPTHSTTLLASLRAAAGGHQPLPSLTLSQASSLDQQLTRTVPTSRS